MIQGTGSATPMGAMNDKKGYASTENEALEGEIVNAPVVDRRYLAEQHAKIVQLVGLLKAPTPVTYALIVTIVAVYAWALFLDVQIQGSWEWDPTYSIYLLANWKVRVLAESQWYRIITSIFMHGSVLHLAVNAYALYILGSLLERLMGGSRMWLIILWAGVAGCAASFVMSGKPSVGISGGISGLVGALLVMSRKHRHEFPDDFVRSLRKGIIQVVLINAVLGFVIQNIDNSAHVGGLVFGGIMAFFMETRMTETANRRYWARVLALITLVAAFYVATPVKQEIAQCGASDAAANRCYLSYLRQGADEKR